MAESKRTRKSKNTSVENEAPAVEPATMEGADLSTETPEPNVENKGGEEQLLVTPEPQKQGEEPVAEDKPEPASNDDSAPAGDATPPQDGDASDEKDEANVGEEDGKPNEENAQDDLKQDETPASEEIEPDEEKPQDNPEKDKGEAPDEIKAASDTPPMDDLPAAQIEDDPKWLKIDYIPCDQIQNPEEKQIRKTPNDNYRAALKTDIKEHGLKEPLKVVENEDNTGYELVDGQCRFNVLKDMDYYKEKGVPCIILKGKEAELWRVKANMMRDNMSPLDQAVALKKIRALTKVPGKKGHMVFRSDEDLAGMFGHKASWASDLLKLNELSEAVKKLERDEPILPTRLLRRFATEKCRLDEETTLKEVKKARARYAKKNGERSSVKKEEAAEGQERAKGLTPEQSAVNAMEKKVSNFIKEFLANISMKDGKLNEQQRIERNEHLKLIIENVDAFADKLRAKLAEATGGTPPQDAQE